AQGVSCPRPRAAAARAEGARGPWRRGRGASEVTVAWTTAQAVTGRVWYLENRLAQEDAPRTDHRVSLRSLPNDSEVRYRIEAAPDIEGTFHTAPAPHAPFRVVVHGDNRTNGGDHALVASPAAAERRRL